MHRDIKSFMLYWLPPLFWMVFIFPANKSLSSESTSYFLVPIIKFFLPHAGEGTVEIVHVLIRKSTHFLNYAFLTFLLLRALRGGRKIWKWKWIFSAGLIAVCYGLLDEGVQTVIPSRTGSIYDWLIDSTGVVFSLGILSLKAGRGNSTCSH
jgi:VanZ family protein